ncbi:uncharacterized protein LOC123690069 [Pieris rapae]|uniref:uncharacterized protein LOC123690069 n=1 Tax=Pieris rapae TaxID=64459 RepID=UPI001E27FE62|nr:uncharacterized protein LOC123690069 [Pieris rapae]
MMKRKYERSYRPEWEQDPLLSSWISRAKEDPDVAFCKACNCKLVTRLSSLKEHVLSQKHKKHMIGYSGQSSVQQFFKKSPIEEEVKKAELNICAMLVEHNLPFRLMDHLSEIISKCFHDSEIAKSFSCKRTKAAAVTYNVLKPELEAEMLADLKSCENIKTLVTKYYSEKDLQVKTKCLTLVDLQGASAQALFDSLSKALINANLNINDAIGFGADTTNVMFGEQGGIIAKIRYCKRFMDILHIVVKGKGNLLNSKTLLALKMALLCLHACIKRILEQWDALKLFFQSQFLEDKNISAEFLYNSLNDKIYKLYFYALDYILQTVNKLNTIFQGDYTTVHTAFKDISEVYMSLLSCYMKGNYLKTTDPLCIDPKSNVNFLPLKDLYLGVNVSKEIGRLSADVSLKPGIQSFLQRMQTFFIELCNQLKTRLPLTNLFKDLQFLDPQNFVYKDFVSTVNIANKFPNIVDENNLQKVDDDFRQIKFDKSVTDLLESGGSSTSTNLSVDKFWGAIGKMRDANGAPKYTNIANFAKALLILPLSNASCERIFSQVNLNKTKIRNRFQNKHVSALITTKEGIKEHGNCISFKPTRNMIENMSSKSIYENEECGESFDTFIVE